jgi:type II secretory pathway pseudopilin PulG
MPTGSAGRGGSAGSAGSALWRRRRGFTYLGVLLLVALSGAGLAALGTQWQSRALYEREQELLFRGEQIRLAVARYRAAQEPRAWPQTLDDLLHDERGERVRHHLRQAWPDPYTGRADWVLLPPPRTRDGGDGRDGRAEAGFAGVRSRAQALRRQQGGPVSMTRGSEPARVSDWIFMHTDAPAAGAVTPREAP